MEFGFDLHRVNQWKMQAFPYRLANGLVDETAFDGVIMHHRNLARQLCEQFLKDVTETWSPTDVGMRDTVKGDRFRDQVRRRAQQLIPRCVTANAIEGKRN